VYPDDTEEILRRLSRLRPDAPRRWGRMSAHQMVCHLSDAFLMGTERKAVSATGGLHHRTVVKWISLYWPFRWPAGIPTRPEVDQEIGGTRPVEFEADRAALAQLIGTFTTQHGFFHGRPHPVFGAMSEKAWLRWGYLHADHHLRQFGL
jgi:hypothetical protein